MFLTRKLALISAAGLAALSISCSDVNESSGGTVTNLAIGANAITGTITAESGTIDLVTITTELAAVSTTPPYTTTTVSGSTSPMSLSVPYEPICSASGPITIKVTVTVKFSEGDNAVESATLPYTCQGNSDPDLIKSSAVTVGGTGAAGSFVDLDPNTPVPYTSAQFAANIGKIDIIYGVGFGGGDNIYSTAGALTADLQNASTNFSDELLELEAFSIIIPLDGNAQSAVKTATKLSQVADYIDYEATPVSSVSAENGTAFAVVTGLGAVRAVIINSKNGTTSIDIINVSGILDI